MSQPHLTKSEPSDGTSAMVLLLHGGAEHSTRPVHRATGSWARARLLMHHLEGRLHARSIGIWLLRNEVVGWNADLPDRPEPSPLAGARAALGQLADSHPGVPVVLVGHSMGARTAVAVAGAANVVGVVGLAPWLPENEPVEHLAGRHFAAAHGRSDHITSAKATRNFTERASQVARSAEFFDMGDVGHYLLRGTTVWNAFTAERAASMVEPG